MDSQPNIVYFQFPFLQCIEHPLCSDNKNKKKIRFSFPTDFLIVDKRISQLDELNAFQSENTPSPASKAASLEESLSLSLLFSLSHFLSLSSNLFYLLLTQSGTRKGHVRTSEERGKGKGHVTLQVVNSRDVCVCAIV